MKMHVEHNLKREAVVARICDLLAKQEALDAAELSASSDLRADVNLDSLGMMELSMSLEDEYGISVADEVVERVQSIGDVADAVLKVRDGS